MSRAGLPDFARNNKPKWGKIYQITITYTKCPHNIPNGNKINRMAIKYTSIFHYKTLLNLPKSRFLVRKYAIWQPWSRVEMEKFTETIIKLGSMTTSLILARTIQVLVVRVSWACRSILSSIHFLRNSISANY
jgi:hypothetical protein